MDYVLTIVARDTLSDAEIRQLVPAGSIFRLSECAADITHHDHSMLLGSKSTATTANYDAHVGQSEGRQKRLLICDMDSTIIQQECIDELGRVAGVYDEIAEVTERAMRGDLNFEEALTDRVGKLAGVPLATIDDVLKTQISVSPGAERLVKSMRASGAYTALVSGGFTLFTGPISTKVGFHMHVSNQLAVENDALCGSVIPPILGKEAKRETLFRLCQEQGITPDQAVAIGDGANDLAMIEAAGLGIAYRAKPAVRACADAAIEHTDLATALYYQGLCE